MDFFEAQDRAKQNTTKLVLLYISAVIGIVVSIYFVSLLVFHSQAAGLERANWWQPGWFTAVTLIVIVIIASGSLFRISQLRKGGSAVAELLGGRKVEPSTTDPNERRLINIVEEMSIASGLPVPDVYVLDNEENINAFAAGFGTNDAAVGVTRGALEQLNRDELQGVIAHEFSHIFNGDMRLNIRLIGILNGILVIHVMGMILMRSMMYSGGMRRRSRSSGSQDGKGALAIILFGVALVIIGYIGMVFGRMIQAAISRQREYLADAAAVQYTRNPDGLAGALNKIGSKKKGAEINDGHAMEMSHLFFASSYHSALNAMFSTHPPIKKRIEAINPSFADGSTKRSEKIRRKFEKEHASASKQTERRGDAGHPAITPEVILAAIGTLDAGNMAVAGKLLQEIPSTLREAAHEPLAAEALIYALLLSADKENKFEVPDWFADDAGHGTADEVSKIMTELSGAKRDWYLPLAELALPSLRIMSEKQYKQFRQIVEKTVLKKGSDNLFAFALENMIVRQLDNAFSKVKKPEVRHHHLKTLRPELSVLLSAFAHASDKDPKKAWEAGIQSVKKLLPEGMELLDKDQCGIPKLDKALDQLAASANPVKKYFLSASIHIITSDDKISIEEKELIRAVSEALDCPIPLGALG